MDNMIEVRCCCQPQKIQGWLPKPRPRQMDMNFAVREPLNWASIYDPGAPIKQPQVIRLALAEIATYEGGVQDSHWAYKAEGIGIETLRLIPGFVENTR